MKKIIFYKLNRQIKSEEVLTKENVEHINGMITRWIVANVTKRIVIATLAGICNKDYYSWH